MIPQIIPPKYDTPNDTPNMESETTFAKDRKKNYRHQKKNVVVVDTNTVQYNSQPHILRLSSSHHDLQKIK
jgi:hypothetical protein